jgi:hypothetical protein
MKNRNATILTPMLLTLSFLACGDSEALKIQKEKQSEVEQQEKRRQRREQVEAQFKAMSPVQHIEAAQKAIVDKLPGFAKKHLDAIPANSQESKQTPAILQKIKALELKIKQDDEKRKRELAYVPTKNMEEPIPTSRPGDKGQYYLLGVSKKGPIITTLSKRVGVDSTGYTVCEMNYTRNLMREIGYSEESSTEIKANPSKWYKPTPGSSKDDLFDFARRYK